MWLSDHGDACCVRIESPMIDGQPQTMILNQRYSRSLMMFCSAPRNGNPSRKAFGEGVRAIIRCTFGLSEGRVDSPSNTCNQYRLDCRLLAQCIRQIYDHF